MDFFDARIPHAARQRFTLLSLVKPVQSEIVGIPISRSLHRHDCERVVRFIELVAAGEFALVPTTDAIVASAAYCALRFLGFDEKHRLCALEKSVRERMMTNGSIFMLPIYVSASFHKVSLFIIYNL